MIIERKKLRLKLTLQECKELSINIWQYIVKHKLTSKAELPEIMRNHFYNDCPFCEYTFQFTNWSLMNCLFCPLNVTTGSGTCINNYRKWRDGGIDNAKLILRDIRNLDLCKWEEKVYGKFSPVRTRK